MKYKLKNTLFVFFLILLTMSLIGCSSENIPQETPKKSDMVGLPDKKEEVVEELAPPSSKMPSQGAVLEVNFIDVGQADAALLQCGGQSMLIDGGNVGDSRLLVAYLKKRNIECIHYMVATHAHEDHLGGLSGPLHVMETERVIGPIVQGDTEAYKNYKNAVLQQGKEVELPKPGTEFMLGEAVVTVLAPENEDTDNDNNNSIVLRVVFGETSFLFTGDMEREEEEILLNTEQSIQSTVLKIGHHGSESSTGYYFLRQVMPEYAVISVGAENAYGHPSKAVLSRLQDLGCSILRTDLHGTITAISDAKTVRFSVEREAAGQALQVQEESGYIGNRNSKKFHKLNCSNLPSKGNQIFIKNREEALQSGFSPCGNCKP